MSESTGLSRDPAWPSGSVLLCTQVGRGSPATPRCSGRQEGHSAPSVLQKRTLRLREGPRSLSQQVADGNI